MRSRLFSATVLMMCSAVFGGAQNNGVLEKAAVFGGTDYRLGPEDVIQVFVYKEPDLSVDSIVIRPDGKVSLPLIGELPANGKTSMQLQGEIAGKLSEFFSDPRVNVIVKEINSAKVSVLGEVNNPGVYKIGNRATLLEAVALAGGFTTYAKRDKIIVIRSAPDGTQTRMKLDVDRLVKTNKGDLFYIMPYDKVYVQ